MFRLDNEVLYCIHCIYIHYTLSILNQFLLEPFAMPQGQRKLKAAVIKQAHIDIKSFKIILFLRNTDSLIKNFNFKKLQIKKKKNQLTVAKYFQKQQLISIFIDTSSIKDFGQPSSSSVYIT